MKVADMEDVVRATPNVVAVFRVKKVPTWATNFIDVGDKVYWCDHYESVRTMHTPRGYNDRVVLDLGASYLEFIDYQRI